MSKYVDVNSARSDSLSQMALVVLKSVSLWLIFLIGFPNREL